MFTKIGLFFKEKMFSGTGLIITLFSVVFAVFLFSNSNIILSKFGFETTTTLKSELTKTQGQLDTAVDTNQNLNKTIDKVIDNGAKKEEALVESFKEREKVKDTVAKVNNTKAEKVKKVNEVLDKGTVVEQDVIKIPKAEYDKASEANIDAINEAYNKLFTEGENHA